MSFIADLHIHSRLSRATSKECNLEGLHAWAQRKGVRVVGCGDFTHPEWAAELREKLVPSAPGLYRLPRPGRHSRCGCARLMPGTGGFHDHR
jgi:hypothetical protein